MVHEYALKLYLKKRTCESQFLLSGSRHTSNYDTQYCVKRVTRYFDKINYKNTTNFVLYFFCCLNWKSQFLDIWTNFEKQHQYFDKKYCLNKILFEQNIVWTKYCLNKILFEQNIVWTKYCLNKILFYRNIFFIAILGVKINRVMRALKR